MDTSVFCIDAHRGYHILAAAYSDSTTRVRKKMVSNGINFIFEGLAYPSLHSSGSLMRLPKGFIS
jgi:hypothetical protein